MVARIVCGKSVRGILNYNENKVKNAEAKLLLSAGFPRDPDRLSFKNKLERFEALIRQNERTKTNAVHITLNFSPQERPDEGLLQRIAFDYMERIGFGRQPFLLYQHYDAAHPHIHLVTVNIAEGGERIETHNIGKNQSEKARKEIEIAYRLVRAEDQQKEEAFMLRPAPLEAVLYGKAPTKAAISAIVREVVSDYKYTSLPELNAVLQQFNVRAYRGEAGSRMYEKGGLVYQIVDGKGMPLGMPIKSSSIFGSPTLKNLEGKYGPNEMARKPYGQRLKFLVDRALKTARDRNELEEQLREQGIRILLRENVQGQVYGVTFIDNATRAVFNGSDLGKGYSAKAFMERLPSQELQEGEKKDPEMPDMAAAKVQPLHPAADRPVIEIFIDIALSDRHEENEPDPFRRKKKKRLQIE